MKTIDDAADASKYDTEHKLKIRRIYERIPSNMENKKKRITVQAIEGKKEVDYLIDDYDSLSVVPLEVKSGKNYTSRRENSPAAGRFHPGQRPGSHFLR